VSVIVVVTVQRQFWRIFNRQQAPARSIFIHLVQKFQLTDRVCDNKKGVVGKQDFIAHVCNMLLWSPRKFLTQCSQ